MYKRRILKEGQEVLIIYDKTRGFIEEPATFIKYEVIQIHDVQHEIPVFENKERKISGLDCFWILSSEAKTTQEIRRIQHELLSVQVNAFEISESLGYNIPQKIKNKELKKMAEENQEKKEILSKKIGFNPRDDSWVEKELAQTIRERHWFVFERENALVFSQKKNWDEIVHIYNTTYNDKMSVDEAKDLSKKRMRYILGSFKARYQKKKEKREWIRAAKDFEKIHREREERMLQWSIAHKDHFPLVQTLVPIPFWAGPYFNECIERIPHVFTDASCNHIKPGVTLQVISYDSVLKYIKLDFTNDVKKQIKEISEEPWRKDGPDYDIWVKPEEIEKFLKILEPLD